jgi:predicted CDP-diglyceride synthetase/phosphatidate cytidylyltransferase
MWGKTFAAIIGGCLLSMSLMLNLNYLLNIQVDHQLLLGLLISFPLWIGGMLACYAANTTLQAWKRCAVPFVVSAVINAYYFIG